VFGKVVGREDLKDQHGWEDYIKMDKKIRHKYVGLLSKDTG
jgi:hypothetical protein